MASERILRFTRTERSLHWVHAVSFFAMLATGLVMFFSTLAEAIGRRHLVKNVHLLTAVVWVVALGCVFGNRAALRRSWAEVESIDADDRAWLAFRRPVAQGRFNAGQKINTIVTVAFALLFAVSGLFLWLGERNHAFRFDGTGALHDLLTFASVVLVVGHVYLALLHPSTRHAMRGMTTGQVDLDWARRHHPTWVAQVEHSAVGVGASETEPLPRSSAETG
jgi:formate dehydrogenase subunit gamma